MALEVTFYADYGNRNMYGLPLDSEQLTVAAGVATGKATPAKTAIIRLFNNTTTLGRFTYTAAGTAATNIPGVNGIPIGPGQVIDIPAVVGNKVSSILAA